MEGDYGDCRYPWMATFTNRMQWLHGRGFNYGGTLTKTCSGLSLGCLHDQRNALREDEVSRERGMQDVCEGPCAMAPRLI